MKDMKFTLFTPNCKFDTLECDSVILSIADNTDGAFSGLYGIRKGHAKAIFSLNNGKVSVSLSGKEIFSAECMGGFAKIENDDVRVVVDGII